MAAPHSPLTAFATPDVHEEPSLPPQAAKIVADLPAGSISDLDALSALGRLRTQLAKKAPPVLEP